MKKTLFAMMACLILCLPAAGQAFETPLKDPKGVAVLEKLGTFFLPVAQKFGCPEFAWGTIANEGKLASLEFVPQGVKVEEWKRMMTVTVYSLGGETAEQDKTTMTGIMEALTKQFQTNGTLIRREMYKNKAGEASAYFDYETGLGAAKEHNAGIFMRVTPTLAAFMQLQSRGGTVLSEEDILQVHKLVNPLAKPYDQMK